MPRPKNPHVYDEAYHDLVRAAATRVVRVPCESEAKARTLKASLLGFHGALEASFKQPACPPEIQELRRLSYQVRYTIEGSTVVASPRDLGEKSLTIRAALSATPGSQPEAPSVPQPSDFLKSLTQQPKNE